MNQTGRNPLPSLEQLRELGPIPRHVAVIMDGNGRWACEKKLPRTKGHREGVRAVRNTVEAGARSGLEVLTLYAFSEENWSRPSLEVETIMELIREFVQIEKDNLDLNNIRLRVIGNISKVPDKTRALLKIAEEQLAGNTGMLLVVALSYGGRQEIIQAVKEIARNVSQGSLAVDAINSEVFEDFLFTRGLPDPDLLIRTSGEQRVSNLLLWQMAYTEYYFTDVFWPDFTSCEFTEAILKFQNRKRRYGGLLNTKGTCSDLPVST